MTHAAEDSPIRRLAAGLMLLALAGCDLETPPSDAELLQQSLPPGTQIPASWSTSGVPTTAVKGGWVATFRDANMSSLVREGLQNNRDLVAAAARVDAALQTVVIAGAPLLPEVGLEGGTQRSEIESDRLRLSRTGGRTRSGAVLAASWEVDLWGRLRSSRASTAALARSIADEARYLQLSIGATIARAWIANVELERLKAVSRTAAANYAELLALTDERAAQGTVSDFDVVQARSRLAAAKAATNDIQTTQNEAIGKLEVLLGRYPGLTLKPSASFPHMPSSLPASGLPLSLLDRRPDVLAARNKVISAFFNSREARLTRLPGITISAAGGTLFDPDLALIGANPEFVRIGVSLLQPIFEGGAIEANIERMSARQRAAVATYGQTVLEAFNEVETALANEKALRQELANWRDAFKDATEALQFANDRYIQGTVDMTDVLVLQQFQIAREVDVIQTQAALLNNRVLLYMALGESL
ncbi:MAG: efflux transporter outer membrane subunit [Pseudomonadota bacterium]